MCESPHLQCAHGVHEGAGAFEVRRRRTGRALAHLRDPCQHKLRNRAQQPASSSKLAHSNLACSSCWRAHCGWPVLHNKHDTSGEFCLKPPAG